MTRKHSSNDIDFDVDCCATACEHSPAKSSEISGFKRLPPAVDRARDMGTESDRIVTVSTLEAMVL